MTTPPSRFRRALAMFVGLLLSASGCGHVPAVRNSDRDVAPPPVGLAPRFDGWAFEHEPLPDESSPDCCAEHFRFRTYCDVLGRFETVEGTVYVPTHANGNVPLIAISPILGGAQGAYLECRIFGSRAADDGYASFYLYQDFMLLKPYEDATRLEQRLRNWVRDVRKAIVVLSHHYPIDRERLGSFGISLGGIRTSVLTAAEPRLRANVICMAGGDLGQLMLDSEETLVERYLARRVEVTSADLEQIRVDFQSNLLSDPLRIASSVDPDSVLYFLARLDDKVPVKHGWRLYDALGRPDCRVSPLGHYTSILVLPWALRLSREFYRRKFSEPTPSVIATHETQLEGDTGGEP